jgi:hypothetical protein
LKGTLAKDHERKGNKGFKVSGSQQGTLLGRKTLAGKKASPLLNSNDVDSVSIVKL